eukprot:TRINITY_DN6414_c0_g2_i1.p1 TRINITY_DN6414_c0_g2~~TRINITY_DN6414_c0_g2_i1.p1  ORF type:complete len:702 (-),score=106.12 TRINITY_DN6414_c0_g2_i1:11-2116(-)
MEQPLRSCFLAHTRRPQNQRPAAPRPHTPHFRHLSCCSHFQPWSSHCDPAFWHTLADRKINVLRLHGHTLPIFGTYPVAHTASAYLHSLAPPVFFDQLSFTQGNTEPTRDSASGMFGITGTVHLVDSLEAFKAVDKARFLHDAGKPAWEAILSGAALENPSLLNVTAALVYPDLKQHVFTYWFAFPALSPDTEFRVAACKPLGSVYPNGSDQALLHNAASSQKEPCFLVRHRGSNAASGIVETLPLKAWSTAQANVTALAVVDAGTVPNCPSWLLRNLLVFVCVTYKLQWVRVICLRPTVGGSDSSFVMDVVLPTIPRQPPPRVVGWEKTGKGANGPRTVNLAEFMDPVRLAAAASDLNLKLMRWRLLPELDVDRIATTKCLLIGAGTLGCNVARALLGWGVRTITFVDQGTVSHSNPVRQSLFTFAHAAEKRPKAEAAAEALRTIMPQIDSRGYVLAVEMPGHPPASRDDALRNTAQLEELIKSHDVIFLGTDTRESRWLPTVLGAVHHKLIINTALGFDSYVVMRHGLHSEDSADQLGCYFCNDVVAPTDSLRDRTLDQQCTVTRPGLAPIAAGLAVEMMVTILHHPRGAKAPADLVAGQHEQSEAGSCLGVVPHQIRGSLSEARQWLLAGVAYNKCTACSPTVLGLWRQNGPDFFMRVLSNPSHLEDVTGLTALKKESMELSAGGVEGEDLEFDAELL